MFRDAYEYWKQLVVDNISCSDDKEVYELDDKDASEIAKWLLDSDGLWDAINDYVYDYTFAYIRQKKEQNKNKKWKLELDDLQTKKVKELIPNGYMDGKYIITNDIWLDPLYKANSQVKDYYKDYPYVVLVELDGVSDYKIGGWLTENMLNEIKETA